MPNHFLSMLGRTEDWVRFTLDPKSSIVRADEIKIAVIGTQNPKQGKYPFFVLVGQVQSINLSPTFNDDITRVCLKVLKERGNANHVSVAADGGGCDNRWVVRQLILFLKGKQRHLGLIDTNHNGKNFRY